jgi:signal transduction histidine kinase
MSGQTSLRLWPVGVAVCVATVTALVVGTYTVGLPRVPTTRMMLLGILLNGAWMVTGLIAWRARPENKTGVLMVAVGVTYMWTPLGSLAGVWGTWFWLIAGGIPGAILQQLALAFPSGRLTRPALVLTVLGYLSFAFGATRTATLVEAARCPPCPPNPFPTAGLSEVREALETISPEFGTTVTLAALALLAYRWVVASAPMRRVLAPMLFGLGVYVAVSVYFIIIGRGGDGRPGTLLSFAFGAIPLGFLAGLLRTRRHRSVVADLVVELGAMPEPGALRDLLARTLGDPSLQVGFWIADRQAYVGPDGSPMTLPEDDEKRRLSVLEHQGEPLAALVHDPALLEDPKLLNAVSTAARLALENSRLQAQLRARLLEVRESRARIVAAGDAERRRIERNLHDGAQQKLLGLRLAVRMARDSGDGAGLDARLAEIDAELQGALEELRTLARGVHSAVLSDEGLEPALETIARRAAIPTTVRCRCRRLPAPVETAAYYVASEALANAHKHAQATRATIDVSVSDGHAVIEVGDDGCGGADPHGSGLRGLRDRVEALDGTLDVDSRPGGGTRVRASIPTL